MATGPDRTGPAGGTTGVDMAVTKRADARRNHARILEVAEAEVAEHGANASLEQIARVAGVGSATVAVKTAY